MALEKLVKPHILEISPYKPGKPVEELERETAHLFGIARLGKKVSAQMRSGISALEDRGDCTNRDGTVTMAH